MDDSAFRKMTLGYACQPEVVLAKVVQLFNVHKHAPNCPKLGNPNDRKRLQDLRKWKR